MSTPTEFDWDEDKAARVYAETRIRFEVAIGVFLDRNRLDFKDTRHDYGEERRIAIGSVDGILLTVVYVMRGATCRIITAWRSSRSERKRYHDAGKA